MSADRAEEIIRQKIKNMQATEDAPMNAHKLWQRLDANEDTGKKQPLTFYWAAAAILLVIIITGLALLPTQQDTIAMQQPAEEETNTLLNDDPASYCATSATDGPCLAGIDAMPMAAMMCYNTNIEDTILTD